jgi:hypothetical protein
VRQPSLDSAKSPFLFTDDPNQHAHKMTRDTLEQNDTIGTEMLEELQATLPASVERVTQQEVQLQCDPSNSAFAFRLDTRERKERQKVDIALTTTCNRNHNRSRTVKWSDKLVTDYPHL